MTAEKAIKPEELDPHSWKVLNEATHRLEEAWRIQLEPDISSFTVSGPDWFHRCVLVELIKVDQECAWQRGIRRLTEDYLARWSELAESANAQLELIRAECLTRCIADRLPTLEELQSRFPDLVKHLDLTEIAFQAYAEDSESQIDALETLSSDSLSTPGREPPKLIDATKDARIGTSVGRYGINGFLGHGGMGIVYRAWDPQLSRDVALKIPRFDPVHDKEITERFLREATTAASIHHRSVCPVHDSGVVDGVPYLVMALVTGRSLAETIRTSGPLPSQRVAEIVAKLARALESIHATGILHRDVSASNVIIDTEREPVLMDFGLARAADLLTDGQLCSGTPAYMAPEALSAGGNSVDLRADIFSLGVVFYQMLTGALPQRTETVFSETHHKDQISPPSALTPQVDKRIEAICLRAIAAHPAKRYQSAAELADALDEYLTTLPKQRWYQARWIAATCLGIVPVGFIFAWQAGLFERPNATESSSSINLKTPLSSRIPDFPRETATADDERAERVADLNRIRGEIDAPPRLSKDPWALRNVELRRHLTSKLRESLPPDLAIEAAGMLVCIPWPAVKEARNQSPDTIYWDRRPRADNPSVPVDPGPGKTVDHRLELTHEIPLEAGGSVIVCGRVEPGSPHNDFRLKFNEPRPFYIRIISLTRGFETKVIGHWKVAGNTPSNSEATDKHGHRLHRHDEVSLHPDNWHSFQVVRGEANPLDAQGDYLLCIWQPDSQEDR